jgi:thiosulfate/3-mercaptopyruvate sulfurtransferase
VVSQLITPDDLNAAIATGTGGATVIDVRWRLNSPDGLKDYDDAHIPGAAFVDVDAQLCGPPGAGGRHPLPDLADLQQSLRRAGVRATRPVVVYDYGDGMPAARAWWTLRWAGHPDVRVLDGGFAAWTAAGHPIETVTPEVPEGDFVVDPGHLRVLDAAAVAAGDGLLIDARQPPRYRGETEPIDPVAGHIPGAANVPYADLVAADGRLRAADELRARFARSGASPSTATAAYCGSGITAAHTVLALTEAGFADPGLYVGSWSHWITDPARPIATGADA